MVDKTTFDDGEEFGYYSESSINTDGFAEKIENGEILPINPYLFTRVDGVSPKILFNSKLQSCRQLQGYSPFYSFVRAGQVNFSARNYSIVDKDTIIGTATNKLLNRARNVEIDLGVALGEYHETAEFVASSMKKVAGGIRAIRKGNLSEALRILRSKGSSLRGVRRKTKESPYRGDKAGLSDVADAAADTQLALQFGLKPIINDVSDAIQVLSDQLENAKPHIHTVRSSHSEPIDLHKEIIRTNNNKQDIRSIDVTGSARCSAKIEYVVDNPITATLSSVGFINPVSILWETMPLSFVVDWFLPVGDFLLNVYSPPGLKVLRGYTYFKCEGSVYQSHDLQNSKYFYWMQTDDYEKDRDPLSEFPDYTFIVPDLSLSKGKVMSGLALLWNAFS